MNTNKLLGIWLLITIAFALEGCTKPPVELSGDLQNSTPVSWPVIKLIPITQGLENPVHITHAKDSSGRIYVVEQAGRVRILERGQLSPTPLLDISDRVLHQGEQGLLSVAFPPGFPDVAHFYVYYTNIKGDNLVARISLRPGSDTQADPTTERVILYFNHPEQRNHNGGQIAFGPDGYLYIGTGDGGGANDPLGNAQNPNVLLGKLLRIDVESGVQPYTIPNDNPYSNTDGYQSEIWSLGLRNPWRFSFDRETGDLYISDVGQNKYEEVNIQPAGSPGGENYGWNILEGFHCFNSITCNETALSAPVVEYSHTDGNCSITGGHVYRGQTYPAMGGIYFLADFCSHRIFGLQQIAGSWVSEILVESNHAIASFGEDQTGELFIADYNTGVVYSSMCLTEIISIDLRTFSGMSTKSFSFSFGITTVFKPAR
jgi:glucose/arabinose dehydrogenase